jgi:1,4-dihydroxy-2-naphthoate octaprenyltransferase
MLANNLCDMEADYKIGRYTLPIVIGREQGLILFNVSYILGATAIGLGILLKVLPLRGILMFLVFIPVFKNARRFSRQPDKIKTFPFVVWNLNLIGLALVATLLSQLLF